MSTGLLRGDAGSLRDLASGGTASVAAGQPAVSIEIVRQARSELQSARAGVGAFQALTLESSRAVLSESAVQLTSALSSIRNADVAAEASHLIRSQLVSNATFFSVRTSGCKAGD